MSLDKTAKDSTPMATALRSLAAKWRSDENRKDWPTNGEFLTPQKCADELEAEITRLTSPLKRDGTGLDNPCVSPSTPQYSQEKLARYQREMQQDLPIPAMDRFSEELDAHLKELDARAFESLKVKP